MAGKTNIKKSPQVFLREIQLENDVKTLTNYHRLLHAWMAELRSASPTTQIGENGWTPRYIVPAHDKVVDRIKQLNPAFNHDTPIAASVPMPLMPITVKENAVRVVSVGEDGQVGVVVDQGGDWIQTLSAAFGGEDLRVYSDKSRLPTDAYLDAPAYHLVLMPVNEWRKSEEGIDAAYAKYDALTAGVPDGRTALGRMVLRAGVLPGMSSGEVRHAVIEAARWVGSGDGLPKHVMGGGIAAFANAARLAEEGLSVFKGLVCPCTDDSVVENAGKMIRARALEAVREGGDKGMLGMKMRRYAAELAEESKE